jgi:hypothetical protein
MRSRHPVSLTLSSTDNRAAATLTAPGLSPGATVTRSGTDENTAIAATLRGLADMLDASRREERRKERRTGWVRVSMLVDVEAPLAEILRAHVCEERAVNGDMRAANESLDLAIGWISAALHDEGARRWKAFDWTQVDDCQDEEC